MTLREIMNEMLEIIKGDVEKYLSGSNEDFFYRQVHTEKYGSTDGNYQNRKRLCYGLLFGVCNIPEPQREEMVRQLLEQEIISREREDFQGIGENLEILTLLMQKYRRDEDREIFDRAKNANFDCFLGYDPDHDYSRTHVKPELYSVYISDPEAYGFDDCMELAESLGMREQLCKLTDIFKQKEQKDMSLADCKRLLRYSELTGREEDREAAIRGEFRLALAPQETDDMTRLMAYEHMISLMTEKGEIHEAFDLLCMGTEYLRKFNKTAFYECALKIMDTSPEIAGDVWKYTGYYADMDIASKDLDLICYNVVGKCAEINGDKEVEESIEKLKSEQECG